MNKDKFNLSVISIVSLIIGVTTIIVVYIVTSRPAPSAPVSRPQAATACYLEFNFPTPSPSPTLTLTPTPTVTPTKTPTPTPTITLTPTLTPTPVLGCGQACTSTSNFCPSGLVCAISSGTSGFCAIPAYQTACKNATAATAPVACCQAPTSTPTPTATSTPTPTKTPTPTPTPTITPTPTPPPSCDGLTASYTGSTPSLGNPISLTCSVNASYKGTVTYDFVLIHKDSPASPDPVPTPTPFASGANATVVYTLPQNQYGYYLFMCRVCSGAFCTSWQRP